MADIEFGDAGVEVYSSRGTGLGSLMNWLGAFLSMALIAGLGYWGYQLMVRDVSGVPVVRALAGPMRMAPDDPGGQVADHQGLAVNNIAAEGTAEAPADRLVLAPAPTVLAPEDQTAGELAVLLETQSETVLSSDTELTLVDSLTNDAEADEPIALDRATLIEAALNLVLDPTLDTALSPAPDAVSPQAEPSPANAVLADIIAADVAGVARSLRPEPRPDLILASLDPAPLSEPAYQVATVDPDLIPAGTRLAQLGAFESAELAEKEWTVLSTKFEDYMGGKKRVIQKAQSGGKVFYRLRAHGFEDLSDARRFCSALLAGQANCIPVVTR